MNDFLFPIKIKDTHMNYKSTGGRRMPLTPKDKRFIMKYYKTVSVMKIAARLHRANNTIYEFLDAMGLEPFRSRHGLARSSGRKVAEGCFDETQMENWLVGDF